MYNRRLTYNCNKNKNLISPSHRLYHILLNNSINMALFLFYVPIKNV